MTDKKTLCSFFITIFIIGIIYFAVSADSNSRSMGFGGELPQYNSFTEEVIHSNDFTLYLYRNRTEILGKIKRILPPEGMLIFSVGERAVSAFSKLTEY